VTHQDRVGQGERTRQNIVTALTERLRLVTYQQVTVGELMRQASVGRSTFYRHFSSKLDVLLLHHTNRFRQMLADYQSEQDWLALEAAPSLHHFFGRVAANSNLRRSLGYTLGADSELAKHKIARLIVNEVEANLARTLPTADLTLPLPMLTSAIAANIQSQVVAFKDLTNKQETEAFVNRLQHLNRGLILAALGRV